jgi:hypothetical protein
MLRVVDRHSNVQAYRRALHKPYARQAMSALSAALPYVSGNVSNRCCMQPRAPSAVRGQGKLTLRLTPAWLHKGRAASGHGSQMPVGLQSDLEASRLGALPIAAHRVVTVSYMLRSCQG